MYCVISEHALFIVHFNGLEYCRKTYRKPASIRWRWLCIRMLCLIHLKIIVQQSNNSCIWHNKGGLILQFLKRIRCGIAQFSALESLQIVIYYTSASTLTYSQRLASFIIYSPRQAHKSLSKSPLVSPRIRPVRLVLNLAWYAPLTWFIWFLSQWTLTTRFRSRRSLVPIPAIASSRSWASRIALSTPVRNW